MRIMVGNLPDDINEDTIREALSDVAPVNAIKPLAKLGQIQLVRCDATRPSHTRAS